MSCGEETTAEAAMFNKPLDLKVDAQGRVYVMDWGDMHIKVYDGQGRFLRTLSRQGQGPGEFDTPAFFSLMTDGRICILDGRQRRVTLLTNEGQYLSSFPLDAYYRSLAVDGQNRLYLAKWETAGELKLSTEYREIPYVTRIFRTDASGKEMTHLADFLGESMIMKVVGQGSVSAGGLYTIAWNINRRGKIYGGYNENYLLAAYGTDGKPEFAFGREFNPLKNPKYSGQVGQKKTMPAFNRTILFDDEDNLWVELYKDEKTTAYTYDVFSPDGIFLKQVKVDVRIFAFRNGKMYSLVRPEDGYPSVKRFKMEPVPD
ncbi:MAG: 6-bladed beta-propeller [Candidatus Aminicenantes bacterium]|nr:6-bladed beta-propeller [Candidatus Aminicenantes bacterium]